LSKVTTEELLFQITHLPTSAQSAKHLFGNLQKILTVNKSGDFLWLPQSFEQVTVIFTFWCSLTELIIVSCDYESKDVWNQFLGLSPKSNWVIVPCNHTTPIQKFDENLAMTCW